MNVDRYLARPDVSRALDELDEVCFAALERGDGEEAFPDAIEFLRERNVDPPETGTIHLHHTEEPPGTTAENLLETRPAKPRPDCPGGDSWPRNCKLIKGQVVCSWVDHCPEG